MKTTRRGTKFNNVKLDHMVSAEQHLLNAAVNHAITAAEHTSEVKIFSAEEIKLYQDKLKGRVTR